MNWKPFAYGSLWMCQSVDSRPWTHIAPGSQKAGGRQWFGIGLARAGEEQVSSARAATVIAKNRIGYLPAAG